jgi:CelD/BcsL family acetyltransferase involved in cellulose biosynthesis
LPHDAPLEVVSFDRLAPADLACWQRLRGANAALDSPYFHPGFAAAVHGVSHDVVVAVARGTDGSPTMFLPVQVHRGIARPAGWPGVDFQAPIAAAGTAVDADALLRAGRWRALAFDHLLADAAGGLEDAIEVRHDSPFVDVTGGLDGYLERASSTGRQNMQQARRRTRKLEEEVGPLRFVADSDDPELLGDVVRLKRGQYRATGAADYFAAAGRQELLGSLLGNHDRDFGAVLSGVYAGDRLVAAHFGLRSDAVLHWWFPVYDPELARFGPGWLLLRQLVLAGPDLGITRIDLGRGDDEYKRRAKTGDTTVCEARVESGSLGRRLRAARREALTRARSSNMGTRGLDLARGLRARIRAARSHRSR